MIFPAGFKRSLAVGASLAASPETGQLLVNRRHEPVLACHTHTHTRAKAEFGNEREGSGSVRRVDVRVRQLLSALRVLKPDAPESSPLSSFTRADPVTLLLFLRQPGGPSDPVFSFCLQKPSLMSESLRTIT